ncbi:MAG TPA: ABC transporter ATP-binding protein [Magnetospirillaceae bacterium]|jgi:dipeptide transport system ATP-binding protein
MALLEIEDLTVSFATGRGTLHAVDGVSFSVDSGEVMGIVGESGSGKSVSMLAVMGLLPPPAIVTAQRLRFDGRDLQTMRARERRRIIGKDVAMIFQEPMTSLNPSFTVGYQIIEAIESSSVTSRRQRRHRAIELLERVGIPAPEIRIDAYPHQLSGGMNQRVMIAMALAGNPRLLLADEPTTALDVTVQAQILDLLLTLQRERNMALILITHDMGVIAETVQRVLVMYAGQVVETQAADALFAMPRHPYTGVLLDALPERSIGAARLPVIPGVVPGLSDRPSGCLFHPRCRFADRRCADLMPELSFVETARVRCHYPLGTEKGR